MNIVHVIPVLTKGGAERIVLELANRAVGRGHRVAVLAAVPAPYDFLANRLHPAVDLRYIASHAGSPRRAYAQMLPWMLRNKDWLFDKDIVHCHLTFGSVFAALLQALRRVLGRERPAVVETYHAVGMPIPYALRAIHAALISRRDAVAFMAEDPFWGRFMSHRPKRLWRIIQNGIAEPPKLNRNASRRYRDEHKLPLRGMAVGSISRLVPERRPELLLETFAILSKTHGPDAFLLLGGEGPERARLQEQAVRLGIADRVYLTGLVEEPVELLGLIDLYLTVNVGPTTGVAALEAVFSGVPVLALQLQQGYRAGAQDWIWSSTEPEAVAARAAELLSDSEALRALAEMQQARARDAHGVEAMAEAYERLYEEALARRRA